MRAPAHADERTTTPATIECVDLLDALLRYEGGDVRGSLLEALSRNAPTLEVVNFDTFEIAFDREANEARVFDVLDGNAQPTTVTLQELRERLD